MRTLTLCLAFILSSVCNAEEANETMGCEGKLLTIGTVNIDKLLSIFDKIRKCIESDGSVEVYVYGKGGPISEGLAFFDLMRTSNVSKHTTFIAIGRIYSASNLVWLAAETRIVLPSSSFLLHAATLNLGEEDSRVREDAEKQIFAATKNVVNEAVGVEASDFWDDILQSNTQGRVFSAKEALEIGWATTLREYIPTED